MKKWYYINLNSVVGPCNLKEIISKFENNEINDKNYFWCSGLREWDSFTIEEIIRIDTINVSQSEMPNFENVKSENMQEKEPITDNTTENIDSGSYSSDVGNVCIKISGILLMILGVFNTILGFVYITYPEMGIINALNIIFGIAFLFIGYGVIKLNKTAYSWGLGSSALNLIILVVDFLGSRHIPVTLIFFIFILYSLVRYKKLFK